MPRTRLYPLEDLEDIPGTKVFTALRSREAYYLHKFCMSLMKADNREAFKADERGYVDGFNMTDEQKQAVLDRDLTKLIELGGNMYFLVKLASTDGLSALKAVCSTSGMGVEEYTQMMLEGGRSPAGIRSIRDNK